MTYLIQKIFTSGKHWNVKHVDGNICKQYIPSKKFIISLQGPEEHFNNTNYDIVYTTKGLLDRVYKPPWYHYTFVVLISVLKCQILRILVKQSACVLACVIIP